MHDAPTTRNADSEHVRRANELRKNGQLDEAVAAYTALASGTEHPPAEVCIGLAQCYLQQGDEAEAFRWLTAVADREEPYTAWQRAAQLLPRPLKQGFPGLGRTARLALLSSSTTVHFTPLLRLAAARFGIALDIREAHYGQYRQELLNPDSATYAFEPDFILLAVDNSALRLPVISKQPERSVDDELRNWTSLWHHVAEQSNARVIQFNFPTPVEEPLGHLGAKLPGARSSMIQALNRRLGAAAGDDVALVDCDRLSATLGKRHWFDPRYWFLAKEAVSLEALPMLARHTAAVMAAALGMSRKCLVLDLDNTLWGGVIGEDGLAGIRLGQGAEGEAFVAFQEYILRLKQKGVILAVCSKNNEADARLPFEEHPEMRLTLEDLALFVANWKHKPDNLRDIAQTLNIGLDALTFVDDNPVEREAVRTFVPEVDVVSLPEDPAHYVRALSEYLLFETSALTAEDEKKTEQYRARAQSIQLQKSAASLEAFYDELQMEAIVAPFDDFHVPRIAQLIGKTNQFNLTTRRHGVPEIRAFMSDPETVAFYLRLSDRFADHGLVSLMIATKDGAELDIDTWLMSCRVIGRTVESLMLSHLCQRARELGCTRLKGTYIPTAKNGLVKEVYPRLGFEVAGEEAGTTHWVYDLGTKGDITNSHIDLIADAEPVQA